MQGNRSVSQNRGPTRRICCVRGVRANGSDGIRGSEGAYCRRQYAHALPAARAAEFHRHNEITEATNGQAAIALLHAHSPDLVLTDLAMAPMDGLEFTRHIRNHEDSPNPFVPIIMVSGHTEKHRVEAARDAGVTEFLAKPVNAHNLFSRIAEIVGRPRAFVRCDTYFGPDRRRRQLDAGPRRRAEYLQQVGIA